VKRSAGCLAAQSLHASKQCALGDTQWLPAAHPSPHPDRRGDRHTADARQPYDEEDSVRGVNPGTHIDHDYTREEDAKCPPLSVNPTERLLAPFSAKENTRLDARPPRKFCKQTAG